MKNTVALFASVILFTHFAHATSIPIPNGDFSSATNAGSVGGGIIGGSGSNVAIGTSGPWVGTYNGIAALLAPPTLAITGGAGTISGIAGAGAITAVDNSGYFSQSLAVGYLANTVYTLTVDISSSAPITLGLLGSGNMGIALTGSSGILASSATATSLSLSIVPLSANSATVTLQFTTNNVAPTGNIGVELFVAPSGIANASLLHSVTFGNVTLDAAAVPEPGTIAYMTVGLAALAASVRVRRIMSNRI